MESGTSGAGLNSGVTGTGLQSGTPAPSVSAGQNTLVDPLSNISSIPQFFAAIIEILLVFAIPFVVFFIIYAGFLFVTARGNADKIEQAKKALLYALVGGLLILGANLLMEIITNTVEQVRN